MSVRAGVYVGAGVTVKIIKGVWVGVDDSTGTGEVVAGSARDMAGVLFEKEAAGVREASSRPREERDKNELPATRETSKTEKIAIILPCINPFIETLCNYF